ncbi:type VII secretion target [Planosporangium mesophilum]|uniref:Uncharacterized protein n=1 Tax=Planosporangium mesophilum TaxID=689768 RepID=A0A8J3TKY0_9ACTN|nr:hypothetical protein [Planosporangium mesophilum]NJC85281.1 hypothetical protein [Planosporangium mesophilum]GII23265.1 hypothetical protein Pme01_28620 [Planosporangium mesophilum]
MTLKAAEEALRSDAAMWDGVAHTTDLARQSAQGLTLTEHDLSWASAHTELQNTYDEIQQKIVMLLGEATEVFNGLSTALDQVANAYQTNDEAAAKKFKGVWDVRG